MKNRKVFWCFQRVEKGCIGNKWVNRNSNLVGWWKLFLREFMNLQGDRKEKAFTIKIFLYDCMLWISTKKIKIDFFTVRFQGFCQQISKIIWTPKHFQDSYVFSAPPYGYFHMQSWRSLEILKIKRQKHSSTSVFGSFMYCESSSLSYLQFMFLKGDNYWATWKLGSIFAFNYCFTHQGVSFRT